MKDKIMLFIIGVLFGAIISTGAFYIYSTTNNKNNCSMNSMEMNGGTPPEMPAGQNSGTPPEKPSGEMGDLPVKPSESN